jgi:hypothetical protein
MVAYQRGESNWRDRLAAFQMVPDGPGIVRPENQIKAFLARQIFDQFLSRGLVFEAKPKYPVADPEG